MRKTLTFSKAAPCMRHITGAYFYLIIQKYKVTYKL